MDFDNLSHSLYDVWLDYGRHTSNYLNRQQLVEVCEKVGLHGRIAVKVADEVFEKLGLIDNGRDDDDSDVDVNVLSRSRVSFAGFIALLQSDTNDAAANGNDGNNATTSTSTMLPLSGTTLLSSPSDDDGASGAGDFIGSGGADSGLNTSKDSTDSNGGLSIADGRELLVGLAGLCGL